MARSVSKKSELNWDDVTRAWASGADIDKAEKKTLGLSADDRLLLMQILDDGYVRAGEIPKLQTSGFNDKLITQAKQSIIEERSWKKAPSNSSGRTRYTHRIY